MEIFSIFTITEKDKSGNYVIHEGEAIEGHGQGVMKYLRKNYPKFTRFILEGYEIEGIFKRLSTRTKNSIN